MGFLERGLADPVLLGMVDAAQADRVTVGRFEAHACISADANMRAFNRNVLAVGNRAMVSPHPGTVRGTPALVLPAARGPDPLG
jgi:hypothetical protein